VTEVNKVKLRISQICPLTGKGIGWVIVSLAEIADSAEMSLPCREVIKVTQISRISQICPLAGKGMGCGTEGRVPVS